MLSRSTWLHLRFPFSYFLLPIYLFALALSPNLEIENIAWSFAIIHLLLYPASNGYNSYFDKDEKSIGGLKNPPPVKKELYFASLAFDVGAIILGCWKINLTFGVMLLIYGIVSKMYSHPSVRLKKLPITGWLVTGIFQGIFTFIMCYLAINDFEIETAFQPRILGAGALTTLMLWGNYPMTQVYQHEEDTRHHDQTISLLLGITGTFIFVQCLFLLVSVGFTFYFSHYFAVTVAVAFLAAMTPVVIYFMIWFYQVWKDDSKADFTRTMQLNFISATCLNGFFIYLFFHNNTFN